MTSTAAAARAQVAAPSAAFERFGSACALLSGVAGPLYGVTFVLLGDVVSSAAVLMVGGLLTVGALAALYGRLRVVDGGFAALALLFGAAGALGATVHGGYDLANALHPVAGALADAPNAVDPRGLLTFGVAGLGSALVAPLMVRSGAFPRALGYLAGVAAVLLLVLYVGRLVVLDPASRLILVPALLSGFVVSPAFYLWLGWCLRRLAAGRNS